MTFGEGHTLCYVSSNRFVVIVDGVVKANYLNFTTSNAYLQSVSETSGMEVKFANLKIYPVDSFPLI